MKKKRVLNFFRCLIGFCVVVIGFGCVALRVPQCVKNKEDALMVAAAFTLSKGSYEFENENGIGTLYTFKNQIIHWSYFKKLEEKNDEEISENTLLKSNI